MIVIMRILVSFCTVLLLAASAFGQNAVVNGRVTDSSEAAVPNASVTLINRNTGVQTATTSNSEGYFVFPPQASGLYDLAATAPGFSTAKVDGITLEVGQSRTVGLALKPGEVKESITIIDTAPLLTTDRADRGTVVENKFVTSIPLNLRNPLLLLTLTPGVTTGLNAGINTASQSTTNNFRINGGRGNTSEILIDGAANTGTYNNQASAIPQVDAVQEFKVNTSPYAAEFGRTGGGVVSFAIKSGTNDFHGTVHEFLRNSKLDALGFNANRAGQIKPSFKRNQYGFTLGGPVWVPKVYDGRNKTFFFIGYEGLRERSFSPFTGTVPTDLEKRGDFSQSLDANGSLIRIYDPRTTRLDPDRPAGTTRYIRDAFPGNVIPTPLLSPIATNLLKYYPSANQPGRGRSNTDNFFVAATNSLDADRVDLRIDRQLTSKHLLFGHYNWFENLNAQPLVYGNFASPVQTPNRIPGVNATINHDLRASLVLRAQRNQPRPAQPRLRPDHARPAQVRYRRAARRVLPAGQHRRGLGSRTARYDVEYRLFADLAIRRVGHDAARPPHHQDRFRLPQIPGEHRQLARAHHLLERLLHRGSQPAGRRGTLRARHRRPVLERRRRQLYDPPHRAPRPQLLRGLRPGRDQGTVEPDPHARNPLQSRTAPLRETE
jgi:hypothetical protein